MCSDILILNIDPKSLTGMMLHHMLLMRHRLICGQRLLCQRHDGKTIQNLYQPILSPPPFGVKLRMHFVMEWFIFVEVNFSGLSFF